MSLKNLKESLICLTGLKLPASVLLFHEWSRFLIRQISKTHWETGTSLSFMQRVTHKTIIIITIIIIQGYRQLTMVKVSDV